LKASNLHVFVSQTYAEDSALKRLVILATEVVANSVTNEDYIGQGQGPVQLSKSKEEFIFAILQHIRGIL